ncbi:hypothetical protein D3C76_1386320 [compost metagenome]
MPRAKTLITTMNISHRPTALTREPVAPMSGASINEFCSSDLLMNSTPKQLLPILIKVAQRVVCGVDHRS